MEEEISCMIWVHTGAKWNLGKACEKERDGRARDVDKGRKKKKKAYDLVQLRSTETTKTLLFLRDSIVFSLWLVLKLTDGRFGCKVYTYSADAGRNGTQESGMLCSTQRKGDGDGGEES